MELQAVSLNQKYKLFKDKEKQHRIEQQIEMEKKYSKTYIRKFVKEDLMDSEEVRDKMYLTIQFIKEWQKKDHYETKKERINQVTEEQMENVILDVMILLCSEGRMQALTGIVGRCVHGLDMEYLDAVRTVAEICSHMCEADLVTIYPAFCSPIKIKGEGVIAIQSNYGLEEQTSKRIQQTMHIPPMISEPRKIESNKDCGYYTLNKPVILKGYNQHNENIALDSINLFNSNTYKLDIEFLKEVQDVLKPSKRNKENILTEAMVLQFERFTEQSNHVYLDLIKQGNKFWLTHHYDARGRTYSKGYHVNGQGASFKKAMINFYEDIELDTTGYEEFFEF